MNKTFSLFVFLLLNTLFFSCEDPELDALMRDYCDCISKSRSDETYRERCLEKMDSIKMKYERQPRKFLKIIEKTDECY